jgi:hypothetical protein
VCLFFSFCGRDIRTKLKIKKGKKESKACFVEGKRARRSPKLALKRERGQEGVQSSL